MSPRVMSTQISPTIDMNHEKMRSENQHGQTVGEYGIVLTGVLILGLLVTVFYFFNSQTSCQKSGLTSAECAEAAGVGFPYAESESGEACFTFQDSLQQTTCQNHPDCLELPGVPRGYYNSEKDVEIVVVEAGVTHYLFEDRSTIDGCYSVRIEGAKVAWESNSNVNAMYCEEISRIQLWNIHLCKVE